MRRLLLISATALGVFLSHPSPARGGDQELDGLAEEVARLRADIETLDTRLEDQKENRRTQLRALAAQKSTLQLEIQREELRAKQLGERAARMQERARTAKERQ